MLVPVGLPVDESCLEPCGTTPGTNATRASGFRPLSGISVTLRDSTTCPKEDVSG